MAGPQIYLLNELAERKRCEYAIMAREMDKG